MAQETPAASDQMLRTPPVFAAPHVRVSSLTPCRHLRRSLAPVQDGFLRRLRSRRSKISGPCPLIRNARPRLCESSQCNFRSAFKWRATQRAQPQAGRVYGAGCRHRLYLHGRFVSNEFWFLTLLYSRFSRRVQVRQRSCEDRLPHQ